MVGQRLEIVGARQIGGGRGQELRAVTETGDDVGGGGLGRAGARARLQLGDGFRLGRDRAREGRDLVAQGRQGVVDRGDRRGAGGPAFGGRLPFPWHAQARGVWSWPRA